MTNNVAAPHNGHVISHGQGSESLADAIEQIEGRIRLEGHKPHVSVDRQLQLVDELAQFPFGRFLLKNRGWNGYWTDYVMEHPRHGRVTGRDPDGRPLTPLEKSLLDDFTIVRATQQRSLIAAAEIQKRVRDGAVLASLPCGLMRDLLGRDYRGVRDIRLVGIDLDPETLDQARRLAADLGLSGRAEFFQADAWNLPFENEFNLLASAGLNIYETDDDRVTELYGQFFKALAPGGVLVTSFFTPPPQVDPQSEWDMGRVDADALLLEGIVTRDVLDARYMGYRSSPVTGAQLSAVGFDDVEFIWDDARMFPSVVARKPG